MKTVTDSPLCYIFQEVNDFQVSRTNFYVTVLTSCKPINDFISAQLHLV
jgi:hypothetical protein